MRTVKKIFMLVLTIIILGGILASFIFLYPKRYNDNLHIEDVSGDRTVLNNIEIKGVLADSVQQTKFEFKKSVLTKNYSIQKNTDIKYYDYDKEQFRQPIFANKSFIIPDDADKQVTDSIENGYTETKANKAILTFNANGYLIKSDVIVKADDYSISQTFQANGNGTSLGSYGLNKDDGLRPFDLNPVETVGNKIYLYTTTGKDCSGIGGVYDISEKGNSESIPKNIAPVDLKDGTVQIVGMKGSEDWLVFICVDSGNVVLKPFNIELNAFSDDVYIAPIPKGSVNTNSNEIRCVFYNSIIQDTGIINIELKSNVDYKMLSSFYSIELKSGQVLLSYVETTPVVAMQIMPKETIMKYISGTLYTLRRYTQIEYNPGKTNPMPESVVRISAYSNNQSVYQGDIVSDAKEDFQYQPGDIYGDYGKDDVRSYDYGKDDVRSYYYMEIN